MYMLSLSHPVFFPFFSTAPSLFLSIFPRKLGGNRHFFGSEPSLRLFWSQNQQNWQNTGYFAGIPGKNTRVFCRFPRFRLRFCPRPALRLSQSGKLASFPRETREKQNGAPNTLSLFSLEISGNAKCWRPSVFLFVCRKSIYRPTTEDCVIHLSICLRRGRPHKRSMGWQRESNKGTTSQQTTGVTCEARAAFAPPLAISPSGEARTRPCVGSSEVSMDALLRG